MQRSSTLVKYMVKRFYILHLENDDFISHNNFIIVITLIHKVTDSTTKNKYR